MFSTIINSTILAAGIFDWANDKANQASSTMQNILIVVALIVAVTIAWKGKTVGSVILAIVIGGLIASIPALIEWFGGSAKQETNSSAPHGGLLGQHVDYAKAAWIAHKA